MRKEDMIYRTYSAILREELIPAFGCTEPVALALAAASAKEALKQPIVRAEARLSGNIIKNVKSVTVPNTGGLKGIEAAVAAGIVAGDPARQLQVIAEVSLEAIPVIQEFVRKVPIQVKLMDTEHILDIEMVVFSEEGYASVHIQDDHTNIVKIEKDGVILQEKPGQDGIPPHKTENRPKGEPSDRSLMNVRDILEYVETVDLNDVKQQLEQQMSCNMAIAEEGIRSEYGANIGKVLLKTYGDNVKIRAKAMAAAGSDARMSGCSLPVVIVSGSGNQGITASVPVMVYARELGVAREKELRAVLLSDLLTIHLKTGIGKLSAYCGAVSAGCGSGAAIAYLHGGGYEEISHTLVNALAIVSGMICDGAKASCAAKIAMAVEAGIMGYQMYGEGQEFKAGDGIVAKGIEANIVNIGQLAKVGMRETDREILHIMVDC